MRKRVIRTLVFLGALGAVAIGAAYFLRGKGYVTSARELAFYGTSLPAVRLDATGVATHSGNEKKYRFRYPNWFSFGEREWQKALDGFREKPGVHYLEIGLFEGRSAFWMMEHILTHPTSRLTGIDIFLDSEFLGTTKGESYKDVFFSNMRESGFADRMTIIEGPSQVELRKLPIESYDIIYIDGSHSAGDVLEDAVLCRRLLKDGGILIFDDYLWERQRPTHERPKVAIDAFYMFFGSDFTVLHVGQQVFLRRERKS